MLSFIFLERLKKSRHLGNVAHKAYVALVRHSCDNCHGVRLKLIRIYHYVSSMAGLAPRTNCDMVHGVGYNQEGACAAPALHLVLRALRQKD